MDGIMFRLRGLFTAQAHDAVDRLEDPAVMSRQIARELAAELDRTRQGLVRALAVERELDSRHQELVRQARMDGEHAARQLAAGNETAARALLARQITRNGDARSLAEQRDRAHRTTTRLRAQLDRLRTEQAEVQGRSALIALTSRSSSAIREAGACTDSYSAALHRRERLAEYARRAGADEFTADAAAELQEAEQDRDQPLDQALREQEVDTALERLREQLTRPQEKTDA